jgi:hypothetical protein
VWARLEPARPQPKPPGPDRKAVADALIARAQAMIDLATALRH